MSNYKVIEIKQSVFASNNNEADELRKQLKGKKTFLLNLMSSPGSGKTTTLTQVINKLKNQMKIAVMEADIDGECDANTIEKKTGVKVIQLHTGGMCHLDADMTKQGLTSLDAQDADLIILENIGNLVCPAEFDTGSSKNAMILSVPEGDDKPLKYPIIFKESKVAILNKVDILPFTNFDMEAAKHDLKCIHPQLEIMETAASKDVGVDKWCDFIRSEFKKKQEQLKLGE